MTTSGSSWPLRRQILIIYEICIKVGLINFTVIFNGLEQQLLGDVIVQEKLEIEKRWDRCDYGLGLENIKSIEINILKLLFESTEE